MAKLKITLTRSLIGRPEDQRPRGRFTGVVLDPARDADARVTHVERREPAAVDLVPDLLRWRDELWSATGRRPRLAGSGSTWFVEGAHPGDGRVVARALSASESVAGRRS